MAQLWLGVFAVLIKGMSHFDGHRRHRDHERHVGERDPSTERRLASGAPWATKRDILRQFMVESVIQCIAGGLAGVTLGFLVALALRTYTPFPASVQSWVAVLGVFLSSAVGLFFGIYPALRASRLDPVIALRSD